MNNFFPVFRNCEFSWALFIGARKNSKNIGDSKGICHIRQLVVVQQSIKL